MLEIRTLGGDIENVVGYVGLTRNETVNGNRSLSFMLPKSDVNTYSYGMVEEEAFVTYGGHDYRIKSVEERVVNGTPVKFVTAPHVFFDLIDTYRYGTLTTGMKSMSQLLSYIFTGTEWSFSIVDTWGTLEFENFGDDNCMALFKQVIDRFGAEFELSGRQVTLRKQIGIMADLQFRYNHNVKTFKKSINTDNLSTYIRGRGQIKEETDVISTTKIPYTSRTGTWYQEPGLNQPATDVVGSTFTVNFSGTGLTFETIAHFLGGIWEFKVDGAKSKRISTYKDVTSETRTYEVYRGLDDGAHTVVATFKGNDTNNPYTKGSGAPEAYNYLQTGNRFTLYRALSGDEQYKVFADYTSPNAAIFGERHAPPYQSDTITNKDTLIAKLKTLINDKPELSIELEFVVLKDAGYMSEKPRLGDVVPTIYEPLNLDLDLRIMEIEDYPESNAAPKLTLATARRSYAKSVMSYQKSLLDKIFDENSGKLRFNVYDEAVQRATEALNNSLTQLEYPEGMGIVARDPNDSLRFVALRSEGLGVTVDGGLTFKEAITSNGVTTSLLTAGQIKTNNIQIIGNDDLFYWDGNYLIAINPSDPNKFVRLNSSGLYISRGAMTIERPDGYVVMNNGLLQNDFSLQPTDPSFRNKVTVSEQGVYWSTTESDPQVCAAYFFSHKSRYLKVMIVIHDVDTGLGSRLSITEIGGGGGTLAQATRYNETDASATPNPITLTVDLGTPTGEQKGVYIRLNTNVGGTARGRVLKAWLEG